MHAPRAYSLKRDIVTELAIAVGMGLLVYALQRRLGTAALFAALWVIASAIRNGVGALVRRRKACAAAEG
jgi:hypothetical protein